MKSITETNMKFIRCQCRTIGELDMNNIPEQELKQALYKLGCYVYREYHDAGLPVSLAHPSLNAEKKVWSKDAMKYVPESELVAA